MKTFKPGQKDSALKFYLSYCPFRVYLGSGDTEIQALIIARSGYYYLSFYLNEVVPLIVFPISSASWQKAYNESFEIIPFL